jgi:transcriptional regulator with XRE-family HTH domain
MAEKKQKSKIDLYIIRQVRAFREARGLGQEDLALHLGKSTGFIGQIESPNSRAKYNTIHMNELAKLFKCSPKDFMPEKPLV